MAVKLYFDYKKAVYSDHDFSKNGIICDDGVLEKLRYISLWSKSE